jgi:hypothetical protein
MVQASTGAYGQRAIIKRSSSRRFDSSAMMVSNSATRPYFSAASALARHARIEPVHDDGLRLSAEIFVDPSAVFSSRLPYSFDHSFCGQRPGTVSTGHAAVWITRCAFDPNTIKWPRHVRARPSQSDRSSVRRRSEGFRGMPPAITRRDRGYFPSDANLFAAGMHWNTVRVVSSN